MPRIFSCAVGHTSFAPTLFLALALIATSPEASRSQAMTVLSHQKISATEGNFLGGLDDNDRFGHVSDLGLFDDDMVRDVAVGAPFDDDGGADRGAVWLLFLNTDGTVKAHQKISSTEGSFTGPLADGDQFGSAIALLGDLDGDGFDDVAVGAPSDDDGGSNRGAVWVLFLNANGTVKAHQKISDTEGAFSGVLANGDSLGCAVAALPDFDGDGNSELAVGAVGDDDGASTAGAVWVLFLADDGTVKSHQKISATEGGFTGGLDAADEFGRSVASLGYLDGDGIPDLAVGARRDDDGGQNRGAAWVLFLNSDGTVKSHQKISSTEGGFAGVLGNGDLFGQVIALPDVNEDGTQDLAVGVPRDDDGGLNKGAVWILFLNPDGTVYAHQKISSTESGFTGTLDSGDVFVWAGAWLGDLDGDGHGDFAVGAIRDDDGGFDRGAVWVLFLDDLRTAAPSPGALRIVSLAAAPNPFGRRTTLEYALPGATTVRLRIFDAGGRSIVTLVDGEQPSGFHSSTWSGRDANGFPAAAGIYFARLEAFGVTTTRKVVLVR